MPNDAAPQPETAKKLSHELEKKLGPVEPITDLLVHAHGDVPIVEPMTQRALRRAERQGSPAAIWFFGGVVTLLLIVQTVQLIVGARPPPVIVAEPTNGKRTAADGDAIPDEGDLDRLLRESRLDLHKGVYETSIRLLEPLLADPKMMSKAQRRDAYFMLSTAHRALRHYDVAQGYYLKAIDQAIDRSAPSLALEDASRLREDGRFADARRKLCQLLARYDGLGKQDEPLAATAAARLADSWYAQALATGQVSPLPNPTSGEAR